MTEYDLTNRGTATIIPLSPVIPSDVARTGDFLEGDQPQENRMPNPSTLGADEYQKRMGRVDAWDNNMTAPQASSFFKERLNLRDIVELRKLALMHALNFTSNDDLTYVLNVASEIENFLVGSADLTSAAEKYYNEVAD